MLDECSSLRLVLRHSSLFQSLSFYFACFNARPKDYRLNSTSHNPLRQLTFTTHHPLGNDLSPSFLCPAPLTSFLFTRHLFNHYPSSPPQSCRSLRVSRAIFFTNTDSSVQRTFTPHHYSSHGSTRKRCRSHHCTPHRYTLHHSSSHHTTSLHIESLHIGTLFITSLFITPLLSTPHHSSPHHTTPLPYYGPPPIQSAAVADRRGRR